MMLAANYFEAVREKFTRLGLGGFRKKIEDIQRERREKREALLFNRRLKGYQRKLMLEPLEERIVPATGVVGFLGDANTEAEVWLSTSGPFLLSNGQYLAFNDAVDAVNWIDIGETGGGIGADANYRILTNINVGTLDDVPLISGTLDPGDTADVTIAVGQDFTDPAPGDNNIAFGTQQFTLVGGSPVTPANAFDPAVISGNVTTIATNASTAIVDFENASIGGINVNAVQVPGDLDSFATLGDLGSTMFVGAMTGTLSVEDDNGAVATTYTLSGNDTAVLTISSFSETGQSVTAALTDGADAGDDVVFDVAGDNATFGAGSITGAAGVDLDVSLSGAGTVTLGTLTTVESGAGLNNGHLLDLDVDDGVTTIIIDGDVGDIADDAVADPTLDFNSDAADTGALGTMTVSGAIEAGTSINAVSIGTLTVQGNIGVDGGPAGVDTTTITTTGTAGAGTIGTIESVNGAIGSYDTALDILRDVVITAGPGGDRSDITSILANVGEGNNAVVGGGIYGTIIGNDIGTGVVTTGIRADGIIDADIDAQTAAVATDLGSITLIESIDGDVGLVDLTGTDNSVAQDIDATDVVTSVKADEDSSGASNINTNITGLSIGSVTAGDNIGNLAAMAITATGPGTAGTIGTVEAKSGAIGTAATLVTITATGDITSVFADVDATLGDGNNDTVGGGIFGTISGNDIATIKGDGTIDANIDAVVLAADEGDITLVESLDGSVGAAGGAAQDMDASATIGSVLADINQSSQAVGNATDIETSITGSSIGLVTAGRNIGAAGAIFINTPTTGTTIGAITALGGSIGAAGAAGITISAADGIGAINAFTSIDALLIDGNNDTDTTGTGIASIDARGNINFDTITTADGANILAAGPGVGPITSLGGSILDRAGGAAATITSGGDVGDIKTVTPGMAIGTNALPITITLDGDIDLVSAAGTAAPTATTGVHVTINAGHVTATSPLITVESGDRTYTIEVTSPFTDAALFFDIGTAGAGTLPDVGLSSITGTTLDTELFITATGTSTPAVAYDILGIDVDPSPNPGAYTAALAPDAFGEIDLGRIEVQGNLGDVEGAAAGFIDIDDGQAPDDNGRATFIQIDGTIVAGSRIQVESLGFIGVGGGVLPAGTIVLPTGAPVTPTDVTGFELIAPKGTTKGFFFTTADGATALGPTGFDDPRDGVAFGHAVFLTARADADATVTLNIDGDNSEGDDYIIGDVVIDSPGALGFEATTGVASLTETGPDIDFIEIEGSLGSLTLLSMDTVSTPGNRLGSVSVGFEIGAPGVDDQVMPASFISHPDAYASLFPSVLGPYTSIINPGSDGVAGTGMDDFILWDGSADLGDVEVQDGSVGDLRYPEGEVNFEIAASGNVSSVLIHRVNLPVGGPLNLESIITGDDFTGPLSLPDGQLTGFIIVGTGKVVSLGPNLQANTSFDLSGATPVADASFGGTVGDDIFEVIPVNDEPTGLEEADGSIAFNLSTFAGFDTYGATPFGTGSIGTALSPTTIDVAGSVLDGNSFTTGAWTRVADGIYADITIGGSLLNYEIFSLRGAINGSIEITGEMDNSSIDAWGDVGNVNAGDIWNSDIESHKGNIGNVTSGDDLDDSSIAAYGGTVGAVIISDDMDNSDILAYGGLTSLTIGNLEENTGDMEDSAIFSETGDIGPVSIGSSLINSDIDAFGSITSLTVGRDILADDEDVLIQAQRGSIGAITVGDDIEEVDEGSIDIIADSGIAVGSSISVNDSIMGDVEIHAISGSIGDIIVGLDVDHKPDDPDGVGISGASIHAQQNIGNITVKHGDIVDTTIETDTSYLGNIGDIAVYHGDISNNVTIEADGSIGKIFVGIDPGVDSIYGTEDDKILSGNISNSVAIRTHTGDLGGLAVATDINGSSGSVNVDIDGDINELAIGANTFTGAILVGGSITNNVSIQGASIGAGGNAVVVGINGIGNIDPNGSTITIRARGANGNIGDITVRDIIGDDDYYYGGSVNIISEDGKVGDIVAGRIGDDDGDGYGGNVNITAEESIGDIVTLDDADEGITNTTLRVTSASGSIGDIIAHGDITDLSFVDFDGSIGDIVSLNGKVELDGITVGGDIGDVYASEHVLIEDVVIESGSLGDDGTIGTDDASLPSQASTTSLDGLSRVRPEGAPEDGIFSESGQVEFDTVIVGGNIGDIRGFEAGFDGSSGENSESGAAEGNPAVVIDELNVGGNVGDITGASGQVDLFDFEVGGNVGAISGVRDHEGDSGVIIEHTVVQGNVGPISAVGSLEILGDVSIGGNLGAVTATENIFIEIVVGGNIADIHAELLDIQDGSSIYAGGSIGDSALGTGIRAGNFIDDDVVIVVKDSIGVIEAREIGHSDDSYGGSFEEIVDDNDGILDGENDILLPDNDYVFDFSNDYLVFSDSTGDNVIEISPIVQAYINEVDSNVLDDGKIDSQEALDIIKFAAEELPDILGGDLDYYDIYGTTTVFQEVFKEVEIIDVDDIVDVPDVVTVVIGGDSEELIVIADARTSVNLSRLSDNIDNDGDGLIDELDEAIASTGGVGSIIAYGDIDITVITGGSIGTTITTGGSVQGDYDAMGSIGSIIAKHDITGTYVAATGILGTNVTGTGATRFIDGGVLSAAGNIDADFIAGLGAGNISAPFGNVSGSLQTGGVLKGVDSDIVIESASASEEDFAVTLSTTALKQFTQTVTLDTSSSTTNTAEAGPNAITVSSDGDTMTFTNSEGAVQTISVEGSAKGLSVKVDVLFGTVTDVAISGSGSLAFSSADDRFDAAVADVGDMTVAAGAKVTVKSVDVDGDLGSFVNTNDKAKINKIRASDDIGKVIGYGLVQNIEAGGSIGEVKSLWNDVKKIVAQDDIDGIFAFRNVQNIRSNGDIGDIIAGKDAKMVTADNIHNIVASGNVSKITALGDISLVNAAVNASNVSAGGSLTLDAGRDALRISGSEGDVYVGRKAIRVATSLNIHLPQPTV